MISQHINQRNLSDQGDVTYWANFFRFVLLQTNWHDAKLYKKCLPAVYLLSLSLLHIFLRYVYVYFTQHLYFNSCMWYVANDIFFLPFSSTYLEITQHMQQSIYKPVIDVIATKYRLPMGHFILVLTQDSRILFLVFRSQTPRHIHWFTTHRGRVMYICVSQLDRHWSR